MLQVKEKTITLFFVMALISIAGIFYNIIMIIPILFPNLGENLYFWGIMGVGMFFGFYYFPDRIAKYTRMYSEKSPVCFNIRQSFLLIVGILIVNISFIKVNEAYFEFWIALFEEILFRYIVFRVLRKTYSLWQSILVGSILFGVLLHMNGDLLINAMIKIPSGIFLYWIAQKYGIQNSVGLHWLYNSLVAKWGG